MKIFGRNFGATTFKAISDYADEWQVAHGQHNDRPLYIRFRIGLVDAIGHPEYPYQIGIAVPLLEPSSDGLTTTTEAETLFEIEDAIQNALEANNACVLAVVITTNSMREFVFYASDWKPELFTQKVHEVNSQFEEYNLQFMMQEDRDWNTFKDFLPENQYQTA